MKYIVDGKVLTQEEFIKLQNDPNVRLKLVEGTSNTYRTLQKMFG